MVHFLASWGSLDICHRDSGHSAVLLQVAPTDRIRDTTQNTDVRRPKHPCTFLRVFVRRIWVEAWLEICLRPAGSNEARSIMSDVKSVLPFCTATQTFCGKRLRSWDWSVNHPHAKVAGRFLYLVPCRPGPGIFGRFAPGRMTQEIEPHRGQRLDVAIYCLHYRWLLTQRHHFRITQPGSNYCCKRNCSNHQSRDA